MKPKAKTVKVKGWMFEHPHWIHKTYGCGYEWFTLWKSKKRNNPYMRPVEVTIRFLSIILLSIIIGGCASYEPVLWDINQQPELIVPADNSGSGHKPLDTSAR